MLKLVLVSGHTIVARSFEEDNQEIIREIPGDTEMMKHVLVIDGDKVVFEMYRGCGKKKPTLKQVRDVIAAQNEIRTLSQREKLALSQVRYSV